MSKLSMCILNMMMVLLIANKLSYASEGGGTIYPQGVENYMVGVLPPKGLYVNVFANYYTADRLNDADGNNLNLPGFKINASSITPRLVWVPGPKLLGGDLVFHTIVPLVDLKVSALGVTQEKKGLGDITVGGGICYHHSQYLHSCAAINAFLPTGEYNKSDLANIGHNHYAVEPLWIISYVNPVGFNGDARVGYVFNQTNKDTNYRSGQEFHIDYAAGWGFGNGWTVGVGGYYLNQTTLDKVSGIEISNSKSNAFAIGPSIKYDSGKGWFLTAKWEKESNVENRAQGENVWLKVVFPFPL